MLNCWKCGKDTGLEKGKISFRDTCESCFSYLHNCVSCKFYKLGLSNDCQIPGTERTTDKEKGNLCEDFSYRIFLAKEKSTSLKDIEKKLFKDD